MGPEQSGDLGAICWITRKLFKMCPLWLGEELTGLQGEIQAATGSSEPDPGQEEPLRLGEMGPSLQLKFLLLLLWVSR